MGSLTIKTSDLQGMVNKVIKGAGNSKFNTLTNLINVVVENGKMSLTTTDSNNYFTIYGNVNSSEEMTFTVGVEKFSKLVSKMTTENITIKVSDDLITVTGNGTYKIPIQLDVDGTQIKYPKHEINDPEETGTIKTSVIKNIILHNKPSLAVSMEKPCLTGYLCTKDSVLSGDQYNICSNKVKTFQKTLLVSPIVFDLLSISSEEDISYKVSGNTAIFETPTMKLYAVMMSDAEEYPVDAITSIVDTELTSNCTLPKTTILNILDRLSLFINDDDEFGVYFTFTRDGLKIESMRDAGIESVSYQGSENFQDFTCFASVDSLKRQFNARVEESVKLYYGDDSFLVIKDDTVTQVSALLNDPRNEEETESGDDIPF